MSPLSPTELEDLQSSLEGLKSSSLTGIMVGAGSMVLNFANQATVLVQCPFEAFDGAAVSAGHGETPETSALLFGLLNQTVTEASVGTSGLITLEFNGGLGVRIIPDGSGFESYVFGTSGRVFPVY
jgi:hypothetical protein